MLDLIKKLNETLSYFQTLREENKLADMEEDPEIEQHIQTLVLAIYLITEIHSWET